MHWIPKEEKASALDSPVCFRVCVADGWRGVEWCRKQMCSGNKNTPQHTLGSRQRERQGNTVCWKVERFPRGRTHTLAQRQRNKNLFATWVRWGWRLYMNLREQLAKKTLQNSSLSCSLHLRKWLLLMKRARKQNILCKSRQKTYLCCHRAGSLCSSSLLRRKTSVASQNLNLKHEFCIFNWVYFIVISYICVNCNKPQHKSLVCVYESFSKFTYL